MKKILQKILIFSFILISFSVTAQQKLVNPTSNTLTFTPLTQSLSINSGETLSASVLITCSGSGVGAANFFINTLQIPDDGYIGHNPANGALFPGEQQNVIFTFRKTVSVTITTTYQFKADWYDENTVHHEKVFSITVTYVGSTSCALPFPVNRTTTEITHNSARVNWSAVTGSYGYHSQYKASSSNTWLDISNGASNTNLLINNLVSNTQYQWRVRSICQSAERGEWSPSTFFTTENCNYPSNIQTLNITNSSATLMWATNNGNNNGYQYQFQAVGGQWITTFVMPPYSYAEILKTNLTPSTSYEWRVRTRCFNGDYGPYSPTQSFTTLQSSCPLPSPTGVVIDNVSSHALFGHFNPVPGASPFYPPSFGKYYARYKITSSNEWITRPMNGENLNFNMLEPNTNYQFQISSRCSDGQLGVFGQNYYFTTLPGINKNLTIFPNPTNGDINLVSQLNMNKWELSDSFGRIYFREDSNISNSTNKVINIGNFPAGIYFIKIVYSNGEETVETIIKE